MDGIGMKIEGLAELEIKMRQLGPKLAKQALRSAVNAGSQVIKKEAQVLAPKDTQTLARKAIYVYRSREHSTPTSETYFVGVRQGSREKRKGRDAFYWRFLEFGTKFLAARPFMVPAFEHKKVEAVQKIAQKLRDRLDKLANQKAL